MDSERLRKVIIVLLLLLMVSMVSAAFLYFMPDPDDKPKPIEIIITTEADNLDLLEPIDPEHPELGMKSRLLYPGDTFNIDFVVNNYPETNAFDVYLR